MLLVNEPGLYKLIFSSRKPEAETFKDWVFREVLPSIRKTGGYESSAAQRKKVELYAKQLMNMDRCSNPGVKEAIFKIASALAKELGYEPLSRIDFIDAELVNAYFLAEWLLQAVSNHTYPHPYAIMDVDGEECLVIKVKDILEFWQASKVPFTIKNSNTILKMLAIVGVTVQRRIIHLNQDDGTRYMNCIAYHINSFPKEMTIPKNRIFN